MSVGSCGDDAAVGIDETREAVVGIAEQPAPVFDRSHARHHQVLRRSRRAAEPSIIRNIDQQFGAVWREPAHLSGKIAS